LGGALPLGKALKLGAETVKETLAATFRLQPFGVTQKDRYKVYSF